MRKRLRLSINKFTELLEILTIYILLKRALANSCKGNYLKAYKLDGMIYRRLLRLTHSFDISRMNKLFADLSRYIINITRTVILERDTVEDNERISLYLELLEKNYFENRKISRDAIARFLEAMILALATEMRRNKAINIYERYSHCFNESQKAKLFSNWMAVVGAKLPIDDYIRPLLSKYGTEMDQHREFYREAMAENKSDEAKKAVSEMVLYTGKIFNISKVVDIPVDKLDSSIEYIFSTLNNKYNGKLIELAYVLIKDKDYHPLINDWIESQSIASHQSNKNTYAKKIEYLQQGINDTRNGERIKTNIIVSKSIVREMIKKIETSVLRDKTKSPANKIIMLRSYLIMLHVLFAVINKFSLKVTIANQIVKTKKALMYLKSAKKYWKALNLIKSDVRGDILFVHVGLSFGPSAHHSFPLLMEAKRRGHMIIGIHQNMYMHFDKAHSDLLAISKNTMGYGDIRYLKAGPLKYRWNIEPENKKVEAEGINLYQPIFDRVARWQFTYFMNLGVDAAAMYHFKQSIESYDLVLENCYNYVDWAIKHNCKVRFVSDVSHLYPEAGYMSFCENYKGAADMKFIQIRPGYEDYFKNKADAATETLAGLNMTDNPKSRLPVFGTEEMFEKYYKEHLEDISVWKDKAKQWFSHQRSNIAVGTSEEDRVEKERVLKIIHAYKEEGKKVYLASGKLVFDLAVKYTKGCAHVDMCHWITHTVETIKGNPNILLLIKPHPHETRKEITMSSEAVGTIADLIKTELGENTILLKGHWFRNIDIMEYIDVELTWGGTSSLEFQSQGITTLMADECAHDDYPIGFLKIKSIGEYENFLNDPASFHVREDLPDRALMFLAFLGSDDVLIKNKYTSTLGNNYGIHQSKINMGAVKEYVRNGDKELEGFFERLI